MKKLMIGAVVAAVCCSAIVGFCDVGSGNIVGYQGYTLKKGIQKITVIFKELPTGESVKLGSLLPSALEGDRITFGTFDATAKKDKDGKLHWMSKGKNVDEVKFPEKSVTFRYFRRAKTESKLTISGEVSGEMLTKLEEPPTQP